VYCWGDNSLGQLGDTLVGQARAPNRVLGGLVFASINAGAAHTCGVTVSGAGYCWGSDAGGQLGSEPATLCAAGSATQPCTLVPALVTGGLNFGSISAGTQHSCGLTTGQIAYCWGFNDKGQLGDGSGRGSVTPVRVGKQFGS
jgi:alpha-tubulin suppressor-like RCC1 family protein